ncbi:MAG: Na/Pi cotransporter family protein [Candidatus Brocadiia bacterium]
MKETIFPLIGGLALFLYGMRQMSDGLRRAAGGKLEHILGVLTKTVPMAIVLGAAVTCLIQSSSATTVMVVGFVNARLLGLRQAIGAVMGANIGTTITAWLVAAGLSVKAFKISLYTLPIIGLGFFMGLVLRSRRARLTGQTLLGLGLLLLGLSFMKEAFDPLRDSAAVKDLFRRLGANPLLGVAVGTVVTMLLQSSSATIAIIQAMASQDLIGLDAAIPLVLGDNIGTTITAQIASIGSSRSARRAARAHMLFNVFGVAWVLPLVYLGWYQWLIDNVIPGAVVGAAAVAHIAASHSVFNVINTLAFAPLVGFLERASVLLAGGRRGEEEDGAPRYLEPHLLDTPGAAMDGARREICRMMDIARESVSLATTAFLENDSRYLRGLGQKEDNVDRLQKEITEYLVEISRRNLDPADAEAFPVLVHTVNDIERISDHAENITELARRRIDERLVFSDEAVEELKAMWDELAEMLNNTFEGLRTDDETVAKRALKHEERINHLEANYRQTHSQRLTDGICQVSSGLVFLELVANFEKIGDHLTNINQAILGSFQWGEPVRVA